MNLDDVQLLPQTRGPKCQAATPPKHYRPEGGVCPRTALYRMPDGQLLCLLHANMWLRQRERDRLAMG